MWTYYPELLERAVPRYTSFPTAAEFTPALGSADHDAALRGLSGEISLYLHIPFCEKICWYCGCNTGAANKHQRLAAYLDALHHEIALAGVRLDRTVQVRRVAFGGGSPNAIAPTDFVRLIDALTLHMPLDTPDWSIEIDPRTFTADWARVLGCVGVGRASLGVQTFAPHLQAAIGRVQPESDIRRCVDLLRGAGVSSLNFDMMYGLPGQSWADLEDSLEQAARMGAERIALFGYAHVPELLPRQRRIDASALPDQATRFVMAARGYDLLVARGYVPVGFDHFALPGDALARAVESGQLRRNFQGFTEDQAPALVGLGASAITSVPEAIIQNEKNAGRYRMMLSQHRMPGALGIHRDATTRELGTLIEGLLCQGRARIGTTRAVALAEGLAPFIARDLVRLEGDSLQLAPGALPYARTIAALFDPHRQQSTRRFSSAV